MPSVTRPHTVYCRSFLDRQYTVWGRVTEFHAFGNAAPHRVLPVEKRRFVEHDEKLAVPAVVILRPGHRHDAAPMAFGAEFRVQLFAGTTGPGARRVAGLGHEPVDDAVEHDTVVESFAGQLLDPRDVVGRQIRQQFDDDATVLQFEIDHIFLFTRSAGTARQQKYSQNGPDQ